MKNLVLIFMTLFGQYVGSLLAQGTAPESHKQEIQKLAYMAGKWKGEASIRQQNGTIMKINQEEDIQFKLDGTILLIEGTGRNPEDNKVVFNALAIVSYNSLTKEYALKSHVLDGNQTDAYFKVIEENHFEWGFETPTKAKIRYDIVLNPAQKTWVEKGAYSPDGTNWFAFIDMQLKKLD
jgi:hypothetical protein